MNMIRCPVEGCRKQLPTMAAICGHMAHHSIGPDEAKRMITDGGQASDLPNFEESDDLEGPPSEEEKVEPPTENTKDVHNGVEQMESNDEQPADNDQSMNSEKDEFRGEVNKILPGNDPIDELAVLRRTGLHTYIVGSKSDGEIRSYEVDLESKKCECKDQDYNADDPSRDACKHYYKALLDTDDMDVEEMLTADTSSLINTTMESFKAVEESRSVLRDIENHGRMVQANGQQMDASDAMGQSVGGGQSTQPSGPSPEEAAEELREAYEEYVPDMNVEASDGFVWVQTGQNTPDEIEVPGPGGPLDVFDDLLKNPDHVTFVPPDADSSKMESGYGNAPNQRPNKWFKNALTPRDAMDYIDEVLS